MRVCVHVKALLAHTAPPQMQSMAKAADGAAARPLKPTIGNTFSE